MNLSSPYRKGVHEVVPGTFAYLQPGGGYGYSNAGLITDGGEALLVDTLIDLPLAREMLEAMRAATPAAARIGTVVNTHAHPDHTAGNELLPGTDIIASAATRAEMVALDGGANPIRDIMANWTQHGEAGAYLHEVMGRRFEVHRGEQVMPNHVFDDELTVPVGAKEVRLVRVGPAHTQGDVVVYVPSDRVLFAGDVLFTRVHPLVAPGTADAWIGACERLLEWDIDVVVPGHGPVSDAGALRVLGAYLRYLRDESQLRFRAGMDYAAAAADIGLDDFSGWADEERIFMTVAGFFESFGADRVPMGDVMAAAWRYRQARESARQ